MVDTVQREEIQRLLSRALKIGLSRHREKKSIAKRSADELHVCWNSAVIGLFTVSCLK